MRKHLLAYAALALTGLAAAAGGAQTHAGPDLLDASEWTIGPVIRGRNYSEGVPLRPTPRRDGGFHIDIPRAPGSVHYVTTPISSLEGERRIVLRYRVEAAPGVQLHPITAPGGPSMITLYFQRRGDRWTGRGPYEAYRWYATFATHSPIRPGTHEIVAPLNANWTAVQTSHARTSPDAFRAALAEAGEVGFVLGGGTGYGHGVYATGPARLVVTDFRVE